MEILDAWGTAAAGVLTLVWAVQINDHSRTVLTQQSPVNVWQQIGAPQPSVNAQQVRPREHATWAC